MSDLSAFFNWSADAGDSSWHILGVFIWPIGLALGFAIFGVIASAMDPSRRRSSQASSRGGSGMPASRGPGFRNSPDVSPALNYLHEKWKNRRRGRPEVNEPGTELALRTPRHDFEPDVIDMVEGEDGVWRAKGFDDWT